MVDATPWSILAPPAGHRLSADGGRLQRRVVIYLGQYPGNELWHIGVHSGQLGVGTTDTPRNDAADEPAILFVRIWTQQRTTGITLCALSETIDREL